MYTNIEQLGDVGCPVPDLDEDGSLPDPVESECTLGNMPAYAVNASSVDHVIASVRFAAKHNLRFRVRNVSHIRPLPRCGVWVAACLSTHVSKVQSCPSLAIATPDGHQELAPSASGHVS